MTVVDPVLALATELTTFTVPFPLVPRLWRSYTNGTALTWQHIKFSAQNINHIPTESGIYAFAIRHYQTSFPSHGYIMYVGITARTLQDRFKEYLAERAKCKRPRVYRMLVSYPDDLDFCYAIPAPGTNLPALENDLLDALQPPINSKDFSAQVQQARAAQW